MAMDGGPGLDPETKGLVGRDRAKGDPASRRHEVPEKGVAR